MTDTDDQSEVDAIKRETTDIELVISGMLQEMDEIGLGLPYESFMGLTQSVAFDALIDRVAGKDGTVQRAKFNLEVAETVRSAIKVNYDRRDQILEEAKRNAARKTLLMNGGDKVVAIPRK